MRNAVAFFICLMALSFLSASPGGAYAGLPLPAFEQDRGPIVAVNHRYDDIYDDEDDLDDQPPPPRRADPYPPPPDAAPAIEFLPPPRPANCGEFRYWSGEYCADARDQPPYTGPRW